MLWIAHRGNTEGPCPEKENTTAHILRALELGFECEVDIWRMGDAVHLGHDEPGEKIEPEFLREHRQKLWCHAKNLEALQWLLDEKIHCFFHDRDDYTLTSQGIVWAYPGKAVGPGAVNVMPENLFSPKEAITTLKCHGICSNFVSTMRSAFQADETSLELDLTFKIRKVAVLFSGRCRAYKASLEWFRAFKRKYNADFYASVNGTKDAYNHQFCMDMGIRLARFEPNDLSNVRSMYYNQGCAFELMASTGIQYDVVVYARADMVATEPLNLGPAFKPESRGSVFIPQGCDWLTGTNDQLAFGGYDEMLTYCSLYANIATFPGEEHPETMLKHHLDRTGLMVHRFPFAYSLNPARST